MAGASAAAARFSSSHANHYNLALGPIHFQLSAGMSTEFNDNINIAETGRKSDLIASPGISVSGSWLVTQLNELTFSLGFGYQAHLNNPSYNSNSMLISPDSQVKFSVFINDRMRITFHDAFSISSDPTEVAALSNAVKYTRFENTVGADALWDLNKIIVAAGYNHSNYVSLTKAYSYLDHSAELLTLSPSYALTNATNVGLDSSVAYTYFNQNVQNDSTMFSAGPFVENTLTHYLKLRLSGGFQGGVFSTGGSNQDASQLTGWFCNLTVVHQINRFYMNSLSAGHETQIGLATNYEVVNFVRYALEMTSIRNVPCSFYAFYENVQESPAAVSQQMERYGTGIHLGFKLTHKINMGLDYQFLLKNSNFASYSYYQNRVLLNLNYQF